MLPSLAEAMWFAQDWKSQGKPLPDGFRYASNSNTEWLDIDGIKKFIAPFDESYRDGN